MTLYLPVMLPGSCKLQEPWNADLPVSGQVREVSRTAELQLPVWIHWGMEEDWLIPSSPKHDNETGFTLDMWMKRNGKEEMIPDNWNDIPFEANGPHKRFLDRRMEKEGTAPVWFTQVDYMPHATMPEMSFRIWEQFFSKFC